MARVAIAVTLVLLYAAYSALIYTKGTQEDIVLAPGEQAAVASGKALFQKHNCQSCHQVYGLGGYLGPDLTTAYSDKNRGELYMRAILKTGGDRMPNFHLTETETDHLIAYLKYVDSSASPIKTAGR